MNKSYAALALLLATAVLVYHLEPEQPVKPETNQYLAFLKQYNKPMPKEDQLLYRSQLLAEYIRAMEKHNSDPSNKWEMGVNQFSDLTHEEFRATYLGELSGGDTIKFV